MADIRLELPTIQNWSCHSCSGCCRQHCIEITDEERRRILDQHWTAEDGVPAERPLLVWHAGPPWRKRYRLGHQADGACVFLDEQGLCRIHAKFGEKAKPLACRVYPYALHPAGRKVAVSLRFSCPSAVANRGKAVSEQTGALKDIARHVVPDRFDETPPPKITKREKVDWPDFHRFVAALDATLSPAETPITAKLLRALFWINLVGEAQFVKVTGARLDEFLEIISQAAQAEATCDPADVGPPGRLGRLYFRLLAGQYARRDTFAEKQSGWLNRLRLLRAAMKFAAGRGRTPPLQEDLRDIRFEALEQPFGPLPEGAEEMFTRYFRVKVQGLHFCGPAYYGVPLVEGFQSLALIYPAILYIARWLAAGDGRTSLKLDDLARAITVADHHHGYSPAFGTRPFRRRVRTLAQTGEIARLAAWYAR